MADVTALAADAEEIIPGLGAQMQTADRSMGAAAQAAAAERRALSSAIASHGQAGAQAYKAAAAQIDAGQAAGAADARADLSTLGQFGISPQVQDEAAWTAAVGWNRGKDQVRTFGDSFNQSMSALGQSSDNYMRSVGEVSQLHADQLKDNLALAANKSIREMLLDAAAAQEEAATAEAKGPTREELQDEAFGEGLLARERHLAEWEKRLRGAKTDAERREAEAQLRVLSAKTEEEWAQDAAVRMHGPSAARWFREDPSEMERIRQATAGEEAAQLRGSGKIDDAELRKATVDSLVAQGMSVSAARTALGLKERPREESIRERKTYGMLEDALLENQNNAKAQSAAWEELRTRAEAKGNLSWFYASWELLKKDRPKLADWQKAGL